MKPRRGWWKRLTSPVLDLFRGPSLDSLSGMRADGSVVRRRFRDRFRRRPTTLPPEAEWERRPWRWKLWLGAVPAVLALVGLGVTMAAVDVAPNAVRDRYRKWSDQALEENNTELAELSLRRLAQVSLTPKERFQLVLLTLKQNPAAGRQMLEGMVPSDRQGHVPAHFLLATIQLKQQPMASADRAQAEAHLKHCLDDDDYRARSHLVLGEMYHKAGESARAVPHLQQALLQLPDAAFLLVQAFTALKRADQVERVWRDFINRAEPSLKSNPDNQSLRLQLATALCELNRYDRALELLRHARPTGANATERQAICFVLARYAEYALKEDQFGKAYELISEGLALDPTNSRFYITLVLLAEGKSSNAAEATRRLEALLAVGGPLADYIHILLGSAAVRAGDAPRATRHYEIAFARNAEAAVLANNLAYVLARTEPPQLERALEMVNRAIAKRPDDPRFRVTRGQIAVKQNRWAEAIVDLEFALQKMSGNSELHEGLAEAYAAVGEKSLAERHQALALRKK